MEKWQLILSSLLGGGTVVGLAAFFAAPGSERLAFRRKDRDEIIKRLESAETRLAALEADNRSLSVGVAVLVQHDEMLRERLLALDPDAKISSAEDILRKAGVSLKIVFNEEQRPLGAQSP